MSDIHLSISMTNRPKHLLLVLAGIWLGSTAAEAQTTRTFPSLEARIQASHLALRGRIADLQRTVIVPRMGRLSDGTTLPDGIVEYRITVAVDEVFRGRADKQVFLTRRTSVPDERFEAWREARTTFLWFIAEAPAAGARGAKATFEHWDALRLDPPVAAERYYVTDGLPVFSMDLTVLADRGTALERARSFARQRATGHELLRLTLSGPMAERVHPGADANYFTVPLFPGLNQVARNLIRTPGKPRAGDPLSPELQLELRLLGLEELRHFKSDENSRLLAEVGQTAEQNPVRLRAREILDAWQAPVAP